VKIVSVVHVSNVLGIRNDIEKISKITKPKGIKLIVDAAQSIPHMKIDVKELGCDALVFSGHKIYGPTGIGVVFCREEILEELPIYMGGGDMIKSVSLEDFEINDLPWRFEAGTPNIEGGIVLMGTLKWFEKTVKDFGGYEELNSYEKSLAERFIKSFDGLDWLKVLGPKDMEHRCGGVVAFNIEGFAFQGCRKSEKLLNAKDGTKLVDFLSNSGICLRDGFHCAEPLHERFNFGPTLRLSIGMYNTEEEVDFVSRKIKEFVLSNY
jgi:cysteine desulfurase / selenocysteine lyase